MKNSISSLVTKLIVIAASCTCFSLSATAAEDDSGFLSMKRPNMFTSEYKPHVGLLAGVVNPEGDGEEESNVGFDIGYAPTKENFTLGLEYGFTQFGEGAAKEDIHNILVKPGYAFGGDTMLIKHSWVALGVGAYLIDNDTVLVASPMIGFDIPVTDQDKEYITLGANARFNFVEEQDDIDENDSAALNAAVKYWY